MASLFRHSFDWSRLAAVSRASTIMGGNIGDVPPLPLTSQDLDLPAPLVVMPAPAIISPRPRVINETRLLALHLHRGRKHLRSWDQALVREMVRWRREPSAWEADQVAILAERAYWQARDGAVPC